MWLILEVWRYSVLLCFVCYIVSTLWVLVGSLHAFIHAKWRLFCSGLDRLIQLVVEIHFIMPLLSRSMAIENKNLFVIKHWNKWDPVGAVITNIHIKFTLTHWPPRAMAVISVNSSPLEKRWPPFRRRYIQMHFGDWKKNGILIKISSLFLRVQSTTNQYW